MPKRKIEQAERARIVEALRVDWLTTDLPAKQLAKIHGVSHKTAWRVLHNELRLYPCECVCASEAQLSEEDVRLALGDLPFEDDERCSGPERAVMARRLLRMRRRFRVSSPMLTAVTGRSTRWLLNMLNYGQAMETIEEIRSGGLRRKLRLCGGPRVRAAIDQARLIFQAWADDEERLPADAGDIRSRLATLEAELRSQAADFDVVTQASLRHTALLEKVLDEVDDPDLEEMRQQLRRVRAHVKDAADFATWAANRVVTYTAKTRE